MSEGGSWGPPKSVLHNISLVLLIFPKKFICANIIWQKVHLDSNPSSTVCYTHPRAWGTG